MIAWIAWTCVDRVILRGPLRHQPRRHLHRSRHNIRSEHPSCRDSGGHSNRDISCRRIPSWWPSKERKSYAPRRRSPSRDRRGGPSFRCEPSACDSHLELAVHREFAVLRSPGSFLSVLFIISRMSGSTRFLASTEIGVVHVGRFQGLIGNLWKSTEWTQLGSTQVQKGQHTYIRRKVVLLSY